MATTTFSGPVVSTAGFISGPASLNPITTATIDLTTGEYAGRTVVLNRAAGQAVTLPPAVASGNTYRFFVLTSITSNTTTIKVTGNDTMAGMAIFANDTDASASIFETAADTDTITFNGSTTGGLIGAMVELTDVSLDLWAVIVHSAATGSEATPFSATV
jgi:hypothetical protein